MKILIVVNSLKFFLSHRINLARGAIERGHAVFVLCAFDVEHRSLDSSGISFLELPVAGRGVHTSIEVKTIIKIFKAIKHVQPDVLHLITIRPLLYGGVIGRLMGVRKIIYAFAGLGTFSSMHRRLGYRYLSKVALGFAIRKNNAALIVQNFSDFEKILELKISNRANIRLIRGSGVDLSEFPFTQERNSNVIMFAARMLWSKGFREFCMAAEIVKQSYPEAQFFCYGPISAGLDSISELDLELMTSKYPVTFKGESENMACDLAESTVFVLPTRYGEGVPKILLEACAVGRAVVTSNIPGCNDIVKDGVNGFLCDPDSASDFAMKIIMLLENKALRESMSKKSRERVVSEFNVVHVTEKHMEIYEDEAC